ncbi:GNAT family N-acetyltransferase [Granulicella arctica]|uniref:GNAT family N-acetyltransferase n=1 Tax=Granulicella arctica TaxID=940613 RepID=UPI0021E0A50E|nr:GNAT family N-acetyltransferase [Granulicella arctica]
MSNPTLECSDVDTELSPALTVQEFSPLSDPRWPKFLARHNEASVFHTREWLAALKHSYDYEPVGFTTSHGLELENAIVFCKVKSWLTGHRLVSLPFSDHCQPLAVGRDLREILKHVCNIRLATRGKYLEMRPLSRDVEVETASLLQPSQAFLMHRIDLQPPLEVLYKGLHDSCVRRKIKRADREDLRYVAGRNKEILANFYDLFLRTRRKHKLPPQPRSWFENLIDQLGTMLTIHVVSKDGTPIASILTLEYKRVVMYKYGCSDERFSALGGTPFLFWKVIQQAKGLGANCLELGRSDTHEPGLSTFKERLGGLPSELCYLRDVSTQRKMKQPRSKALLCAREVLCRMPDPVLIGVGRMMYRHMG